MPRKHVQEEFTTLLREVRRSPLPVEAPTPPAPMPSPAPPCTRKLQSLIRRLESEGKTPVRVTLNRNRHTVISFRRKEGFIDMRLHYYFCEAPLAVHNDLVRAACHRDNTAWKRVCEYVRKLELPSEPVEPSKLRVRTKGTVHDLRTLLDQVNQKWFSPPIDCNITWAKWGRPPRRRRARRSILYGTWVEELRLIRINPILDREDVPAEFIRFIIYHEMLHHVAKPVRGQGKARVHTPEFKELEERYPQHARWNRFCQEFLSKI